MSGGANENSNENSEDLQTQNDLNLGQDTTQGPSSGENTVIEGSESITPSSSETLSEGHELGKYVIRKLLGRGAMGAVYLAFDPMIERDVAIKVLPREAATHAMALERFLSEARSTGKVNHPHVISIFDIGENSGLHFIVMELLSGGSLAEKTSGGKKLPWRDACHILAQAAEGLAAAHSAGLVHRDIKPENIMLSEDGIVKVLDFGLSKLVDAASDTRDAKTQAGTVLGTPQYMSPEQCEAAPADGRSDIYGLGGTLFFLLTGRLPYEDYPGLLQVLNAHVNQPVPDPILHVPDLPHACRDIVGRSMAKSPEDRYQDAAIMANDLRLAVQQGSESSHLLAQPLESKVLGHVAIAEPSKMQAMMLQKTFRLADVAKIDVYSELQTAKTAIDSRPPDLVLSALQLPDGLGFELLKNSTLANHRVMRFLNSSDSSISDLIDAGIEEPMAVIEKKSAPKEILKAIYVSTQLQFQANLYSEQLDSTAIRTLVLCDAESVPNSILEKIRDSGLLDVQVVSGCDFSAPIQHDGEFELALIVHASQRTRRTSSDFARQLSEAAIKSVVLAITDVESEQAILRAVKCENFSAMIQLPLDSARMQRLTEIAGIP